MVVIVIGVSRMGFSDLRCKRLCPFRIALVLPSGEESKLEHHKLGTK